MDAVAGIEVIGSVAGCVNRTRFGSTASQWHHLNGVNANRQQR